MKSVIPLVTLCALLCAWVAPERALAADPGRAPAPGWAKPLEVEYGVVRATEQGHDFFTLLWDSRVRVEGNGYHHYARVVRRAMTASGVERLAQILISYDPEEEKLVLHRIELRRADEFVDQTNSARVRLVADESELERRAYNGNVTAFIVLDDVRAGDTVDVSYSLIGSNPILGGRYAGYFELLSNEPVRQRHVEVLPVGQRPPLRANLLGLQPKGLIWAPLAGIGVDFKDAEPRPNEDRASLLESSSALEVSDFESWQEVATWGAALYPALPLHPAVSARAATLAEPRSDASDLVLRVLRFVQDEIRYLAISNEGHAFRPHPPEQVLAQRFGDCKDKVYLLQQLLRACGIQSSPMLVHSVEKAEVRKHRPTPFAFDHVILRTLIEGRPYFIDATHSQQGGTLATQVEPEFGYGLVLSPDTTDLEAIPLALPTEPERLDETRLEVAADGSAMLQITTTFLRRQADDERGVVSATSPAELGERYANYYAKRFPDLQVLEPLGVEDQRVENRLRTRERYKLGSFWQEGERYLQAEASDGFLDLPSVVRRATPLRLRHPVWVESHLTVALPFASTLRSDDSEIDDRFFKFSRRIRSIGAEVAATFVYQSLTDRVPAERVPAHVVALQQARDHAGVVVYKRDDGAQVAARDSRDVFMSLGVLVAVLTAVFAWPIARGLSNARRRQKFSSVRQGDVGETPALAMSVGTFRSAEQALLGLRCSCGQTLRDAVVQWTPLRFQQATLHSARLQCSGCGSAQTRYYSIATPER
jgi:transglutaminase-like putative cysteine protease